MAPAGVIGQQDQFRIVPGTQVAVLDVRANRDSIRRSSGVSSVGEESFRLPRRRSSLTWCVALYAGGDDASADVCCQLGTADGVWDTQPQREGPAANEFTAGVLDPLVERLGCPLRDMCGVELLGQCKRDEVDEFLPALAR